MSLFDLPHFFFPMKTKMHILYFLRERSENLKWQAIAGMDPVFKDARGNMVNKSDLVRNVFRLILKNF